MRKTLPLDDYGSHCKFALRMGVSGPGHPGVLGKLEARLGTSCDRLSSWERRVSGTYRWRDSCFRLEAVRPFRRSPSSVRRHRRNVNESCKPHVWADRKCTIRRNCDILVLYRKTSGWRSE